MEASNKKVDIETPEVEVRLANPRGFCAGVERAINVVKRALELFGAPVYVRHEIVHNRYVVEDLRAQGAIFVEELEEIPDTDHTGRPPVVIFSAHGVARQIRKDAEVRDFQVFDATCPLVVKVHKEVARSSRDGDECILIGHSTHPEVQGTIGNFDTGNGGRIYIVETIEDAKQLEVKDPERLSYVSQTTLSVDDCTEIIEALKARFPLIKGPRKSDICYATQNRQDAIKQMALECDLMLVVGARNSSNSNRLRELAERLGCDAYLIEDAEAIEADWLRGKTRIGVTAGASAPEALVADVIDFLRRSGATQIKEVAGTREDVSFVLPVALRN